MLKRTAALTVSLLLASAAWAQNTPAADAPAKPKAAQPDAAKKKLAVGDKAPDLSIEKWVKGDPVTGFEKGQVYVVEFWATWCGPCIKSMPHLTHLQKEYKDKGVRIVGVTTKDTRGNTIDSVQKMVQMMGDTSMGYTVAWDADQKTKTAFRDAAGQSSIPFSVIVDGEGKIAYIGHPMWIDEPLKQIVAGKWDPTTGMESVKKADAQFSTLSRQIQDDPEAAAKSYDEFSAAYPGAAVFLGTGLYGSLLEAGKTDRAVKLGDTLLQQAVDTKNAMDANEIAWTMVDPEGNVQKRDLDFAMKAAVKACELSNYEDGAILDTLARVYFLKGDAVKALEIETKAVEKAGPQFKDQLEGTLKEYQEAAKKGNK